MAVDSAPDFTTSASLPPIPGLRFRHFAGPSDYPGMNDVANNSREANGVHFITPLDGFAGFYDSFEPEHCDKARDLFVVEVDGRIVGYARTQWSDEPDGARFHEVICFLDPAWRRRGIGRAMQAAVEARAREALDEHPTTAEAFFQADSSGDPGADAIFTQGGYAPARFGYIMVRPNLDPVPDAPLPDGLEIRPVEEAHVRPIWDAAVEAFRDAWGFSEPSERDFELYANDPIQGDRTLWRVAWDGDEIAGQVRGFINRDENERFGAKRGWVENISVRRPWRKRGLARALIASTIDELRARGMTEGALGVDTQNVSGALRLYESVGFRPESKSTLWRKPMERTPARG
jgi:GNAT superfamily N-acetyltransferase